MRHLDDLALDNVLSQQADGPARAAFGFGGAGAGGIAETFRFVLSATNTDLHAADRTAVSFQPDIEHLNVAVGHGYQHAPLAGYCTGLLLPGERKCARSQLRAAN